MKHAVIYDRASTKNQQDNYSRVNAKEVGIRIAEQNGFTWEYVKEIGSGTTLTGRPKMMNILDRIAAGEIQVIIVQDLDRLARPEEAVVYSTIRQVIMQYNIIIYTHTSRVDLNNDDDDFVADITMSVAKKERRRILKRMRRSKKAKADQGRFVGGNPGLGYKVIYQNGKDGDLAIEENEVKLVKAIFDTVAANGGNIGATAKELNEQGYTGKRGKRFVPASLRRIVTRKLYIGIFKTKITDKITHRPDLQIISVDQFERVQKLIKSRAGNNKDMGRRGHYIFTGFVVCGNCGGATVAAANIGYIAYQCVNHRHYGKSVCSLGKTYSEHLILPPIIEFLAGFIQRQLDFNTALDNAAAQYGKSITEEAIEAAIEGEIASVQAGKERLIEAISLGILTNEEAATKLTELREQEQRLTIELSSIAEKAAIMAQWQEALDVLKGHAKRISSMLYELAEQNPIAFRRLLSIIFEPNGLRVRTEQNGSKWFGVLEDYQLTEAMKNINVSFGNKPLCMLQ
jgi:DNA invertase Pin-like site-specific DNA recombinase